MKRRLISGALIVFVAGVPAGFSSRTAESDEERIRGIFARAAAAADLALVEGAMGLFDGRSPVDGEGSAADVATLTFDAYLKLEKLENAAEVTYKLLTLGRELPFPPGAIDKLVEARAKHGLLRSGERESIREACGVCGLTSACPVKR